MEPMILGIPAGVFVVLSVVVPTWLVYLGFESHILHLRNRWAYWVVGISLMVFAVLVRGDLAEFAHPLLGALMASAPLLFGRGTLARRVTLSAFGLVIVLPGDLFLDMTFDILAGATIDDHATVGSQRHAVRACDVVRGVRGDNAVLGAYRAGEKVLSGKKADVRPRRCRAECRPSPRRSWCSRGAGHAAGVVLQRGGGAVRRRFAAAATVWPAHAVVLRRGHRATACGGQVSRQGARRCPRCRFERRA